MTSLAEDLRPPRLGPPPSELTPRGREILDQIEAIIVRDGFAKMTVDELASRLKCSKSTLYDLAPNKEELVLVVLDRRWRRTGHQLMGQLQNLDDPAARLEAYMTADIHHRQQSSVKFSEDLSRHPAANRLFTDHLRYSLALLQEIVQEGIDRGDFEPIPPRFVAEVVQAAGARCQDPQVLRAVGMNYEEATASLYRLVCSGLVRRAHVMKDGGNRRRHAKNRVDG